MMTTTQETEDKALFDQLREDHWTMAVLFQRLSEGLSDGLDDLVLRRILTSLTLFAAEHCRREEDYLYRIGHPISDAHAAEHRDALAYLQRILDRCDHGSRIGREDIEDISAMFTEVLFPADSRDGLPAPPRRS